LSINITIGLLLAAATSIVSSAPAAPATTAPLEAGAQPRPAPCKPTLRGEEAKETRETFDAIRNLKKDGASGVPAEAQAILDQMTAMYENDDSRGSAEMADAMREFAGGRAPRRQRC
jgi:hypothetical protein